MPQGHAQDWTFTLVFEDEEGAFWLERRHHHAPLLRALALARRDGEASRFGRTFRGFADLGPSSKVAPLREPERGAASPVRPLADLLAPHGQADDGAIAAETARHAAALQGLEAVRWWSLRGAFGPATEVGVELGRCASTDKAEALDAAEIVGEAIAHQGGLYPATAVAVPFLVALLEAPGVHARAELARWLEVIVSSAHEANDLGSNMLALAAKLVARHLADDIASHQRAAKEVSQALTKVGPRLRALKADPELGAAVQALLPKLP